MDDLPEQFKPTYGIKLKLKSGDSVVLPVCGPLFKKLDKPVGFDFGGKPLVDFEGKPVFVELAILKMLEKSGWSGVWVETYGGVHYFTEMPSGWKTGESGITIPEDKEELLRRIWKEAKTKSCFDVFAWRGDEILFIEAKHFEKDRLRETQYKFIEAAINCGVQPDSLMVAEWDYKKRKPETNMRVIWTESFDLPEEEKRRRVEHAYDIMFTETVLEIMLKSVFDLMFEKLKSISVGDGFMGEINRRRAVQFYKSRPDAFFFESLVSYILASRFGVASHSGVRKALADYDVDAVSKYTGADIEKILRGPESPMSRQEIEACVENAKVIKRFSKYYGAFGKYLDKNKDDFDGLKWKIADFTIDKASILDYLKEIGIDTARPGEDMLRIMHRLDLIHSETDSSDNIDNALKILDSATKATREKFGVVDAVMRIYGSGGNGIVSKTICSKDKPLCEECPVAGYCTAGFLDVARRREVAKQYGPHTVLDAPYGNLPI